VATGFTVFIDFTGTYAAAESAAAIANPGGTGRCIVGVAFVASSIAETKGVIANGLAWDMAAVR
jgi:hypothetical protein